VVTCQVYKGQCICRVASATAEGYHPRRTQHEIQLLQHQKCSAQVSIRDKNCLALDHTEHKHCSIVGSAHHYPSTGIQSSITKFRFEDNRAVEVCEEWHYVIHYLKSVVNNFEESLNDIALSSSVAEADGVKWYAQPYQLTADDIVNIKLLRSPDISNYSSSLCDAHVNETCDHSLQKHCEKSNIAFNICTERYEVPNVASSLDRFLVSTALAICDLVQLRCDSCVSISGGFPRELQHHRGSVELLPYLDAKTFYNGLVTGLSEQSHNGCLLHCDNVPRQLVLDSFGLLRLVSSQDPRLLSAGASSDLMPGGNEDKQKLPNIDQLRAIQDNLAYNVCQVFSLLYMYA